MNDKTDKDDDQPTAAEVAEEERKAAIARGDIVDDEELAKAAAEAEAEDDDDDDDAAAVAAAAAAAAAEDEDEDEPGAAVDNGITIPKARYDEDRQKSRIEKARLEARILELEGTPAKKDAGPTLAEAQAEIDTLDDEYEAHLLEGEPAEAKAKRLEANAKRNELTDRKIKEGNAAMGTAAVEQVRYDNQLAAFEAKYPAMNPDAVEFDKAKSDEIDMLMNSFEAGGMTLVGSLNKAIHYVFGNAPAPKEEDDKGETKAERVKRQRKEAATKKTLNAVKKTPTDLDDIGRDSDKAGRDDGLPNPLKMSQAQFDKLTEAQKAELRDDTLKPH
jgi:hypothetical protein